MSKKVPIQDVKKGMYVADLDRPWIETPFLFQGFEITTDEEIRELRDNCQYIYIDPELGLDVATNERDWKLGLSPKVDYEKKDHELTEEMKAKAGATKHRDPLYRDISTLEQELDEARGIEEQTRNTVYSIMEDVRLGKSVDTVKAKKAVAGMVESIIRNPDALVCLTQLKNKNEYTALHSLRVSILALAFGRHLELDSEELNILGLGALLHDIGKMKVPNEILNKPDGLTIKEFEIIKSHVPEGVMLLERAKGIPDIAIDVARYHHERYDGSGYVSGRQGANINSFGLIGSIVDCYDAITSDRTYHQGLSSHDALKKMYEWRNKDFEPALLEQFIQCMGIYPIGSLVEMNTGSIGVVATINRAYRLKPKVILVLNADKLPHSKPQVIDLMEQPLVRTSNTIEIKKVIQNGCYGINPTDYLPLKIPANS